MIFAAQSRLLASLGSHVAPHGSGGGEVVMAVVEERSDKNNLKKGKESWVDVCRDGHSSSLSIKCDGKKARFDTNVLPPSAGFSCGNRNGDGGSGGGEIGVEEPLKAKGKL